MADRQGTSGRLVVLRDAPDPLLVDLYELTMVDVYRREGMANLPATFSLFVRSLPPGRGYLVAAGLDDVLTWLEGLAFGEAALGALEQLGLFSTEFLAWLARLRFTGSVRAVPEGTIVFGEEPILEVDAPIAEAQLAETFLLNQVTLQTTLASTAARYRTAAAGRSVIDFALRRAPGIDAGLKLARVAGLVGLAGTSNVAGAAQYGLPVSGTMAHAFVEAYRDEVDAFRAFARAYGPATVLLVDTYDTPRGVSRAIEVALEMRRSGVELRGVRLDSGDLGMLARDTRRRLDAAGLEAVQIVASGGLDEHDIDRLVRDGVPIDVFGVGSALGAPTDAPTLDSVYKLVAYDGRPVRKTSTGKATWPGAKQVWRLSGGAGDVLALAGEPSPTAGARPLLAEVMRSGERTAAGRATLDEHRACFEQEWAELPDAPRRLADPDEHPVTISTAVRDLAAMLDVTDARQGERT